MGGGGERWAARKPTLRSIMSTKMTKETPIRDHRIHIIAFINKMEILRAEIDGENKVDMIPKTLLDSFRQFKLNYTMSKLMVNLFELMRKLQTAKGILKDS